MKLRESDIAHDTGCYWVGKIDSAYTVYAHGVTHSKADSSYPQSADGLSIAIARANYLTKRMTGKGSL